VSSGLEQPRIAGNVSHQILLYISAGPDLAAEREVVGRAITEIPLDLGWRIFQTPGSGYRVDREAVELADLHLYLLGGDIRAPVGYEWAIAQEAGRRPIPLLKTGVRRTPAGLDQVRYIGFQARWFPFQGPSDLRWRVLRLLSAFILFRASELGLSLVEMETLAGWRKGLYARPVDEETVGGAGEGGVLLSQKRYVPAEGVPIRPEGQEAKGDAGDEFWPDINLDWLDLDEQAGEEDEGEEGTPFSPTVYLN
jgi:hypothetical protein